MVAAGWETWRDGRKVSVSADLENETHSYNYVEEEVTVEKPETRVISSKPEYNVAIVRYSDSIFRGWQVELPVKKALPVKIESMFKVNFLHIPVWRSANTDYVKGVTV